MNIITNEMVERAEKFVVNWRGITSEKSEAQTFTNEFFEVFGLNRKRLASFEKSIVKKNKQGIGFADLFWTGKLIIESKSAHLDTQKNWDETLKQAKEYIDDLPIEQKPQYILLMNFKRILKYQVVINDKGSSKITLLSNIQLGELPNKLNEFEFFLEFANRLESDEEKANQLAADKIANLYNAVERKGYNSTDISLLLARILFCLFAEDTGIYQKKQFENYIKEQTNGENLGNKLLELFDDLNTPKEKRKNKTSATYNFPYVNGDLFNISLSKIPKTNDAMHQALIECCKYDWSIISPVIFGSLFQSVLQDDERRESGSHYTSEKNILKALKPLFLDELTNEFENVKDNKKALENFRKKINSLTFLDPACGCGNFLVVTYREIKMLDIEIIKIQYKGKFVTDASLLSNIPLHNFYGYEIDKTSAMIAEVAMWLTEHQMNMRLESQFDIAVPTIPLYDAANVVAENALQVKWETKNKTSFNYIVGNPPFRGKQYQTTEQKEDLKNVLYGIDGAGVLDFVTGWYIKAAQYIAKNPTTKVALVSTNSIAQGEQTGILWNELFNTYKLKIHFAHQTFKWHNEAKGVAAVHCVIIGFGKENVKDKYIYEYEDIKGEPTVIKVKNINPYLVQGNDTVILKRRKPICNVPEISFGSMPNDGGHLLLTDEEKDEIIKQDPIAKKWIRPLISAHEYLNGKTRWCLWLNDSDPKERKQCTPVFRRIQAVKNHRESSNRAATNKLAATPYLFGEIRQPNSDYIAIPRVSSENRKYIPIAYFDKKSILSDTCLCVPKASLYHFGILTSAMHIAWVDYVCGRLESRFRYSNEIVYNNYPFPIDVSDKNKKAVEKSVKAMLAIREKYIAKGSSLAHIYEASNMPLDLLKAHQEIDKQVDICYGNKNCKTNVKRIEFLFNLYEIYTNGLFA